MRRLLALPLLAGCAFTAVQLDPPLGQLARWRDAPPEAIAAEPVLDPCPAGNPACARLHQRRADACMGLAMAARAPGASCPGLAEAPRLACAGAGYAAALAQGAQPAATLAGHAAQALLCQAELAAAPAAELAEASRLAALAEPPRAAMLGAWAALLRARTSPGPARCAAMAEARSLATPLPAAARERLLVDLTLLEGCTP